MADEQINQHEDKQIRDEEEINELKDNQESQSDPQIEEE